MEAKISALKAQTAALNAEAAALNKLTDDLKSRETSWTILAATDPKWPFTVPEAVIRCEQDTSTAGGEVLTITANKTEYAFAFPMMETGAYPLDTPIVKPGAANIHQADMYMYRGAKKLCRTVSGQ